MCSHANLGPRDVWGARLGTCRSAFAEFSIGVQAQRHPIFVPERRAGRVHSFFWYWIYGRTESYSMCSLIPCAKTCSTCPRPSHIGLHKAVLGGNGRSPPPLQAVARHRSRLSLASVATTMLLFCPADDVQTPPPYSSEAEREATDRLPWTKEIERSRQQKPLARPRRQRL